MFTALLGVAPPIKVTDVGGWDRGRRGHLGRVGVGGWSHASIATVTGDGQLTKRGPVWVSVVALRWWYLPFKPENYVGNDSGEKRNTK